MLSWKQGLGYGMFENGQLVLLPQHTGDEKKKGRETCRGRK